jgi:hypothetical protein
MDAKVEQLRSKLESMLLPHGHSPAKGLQEGTSAVHTIGVWESGLQSITSTHAATILNTSVLFYAAMVDATYVVDLLVACDASRSRAELKARTTAAAMHSVSSHTRSEDAARRGMVEA